MFERDKFLAAIEKRMKEQGISARKLSLKAGLKETVVGMILRGESQDPGISKVAAIADALGCKVDDLLATGSLKLISSNTSPVSTELLKIAMDSINAEAERQGVEMKGAEWTQAVAEIYSRIEAASAESDTVKDAIKLVLAKD